jgi:hypothetical protein
VLELSRLGREQEAKNGREQEQKRNSTGRRKSAGKRKLEEKRKRTGIEREYGGEALVVKSLCMS